MIYLIIILMHLIATTNQHLNNPKNQFTDEKKIHNDLIHKLVRLQMHIIVIC